MALTQIYEALAGDTITALRWNNEFGNLYDNGTDVAFPVTKAVSLAGWTLTLDSAGVSTLVSSGTQAFQLSPGTKSGTPGTNGSAFNISAQTFTDTNTAIGGTATIWNACAIRTPVLVATNTTVTTTDAATLYLEGPPTASTNETITNGWALYAGGKVAATGPFVGIKGSDIASTSSMAVTVPFADCTGTTTITAISTVHKAGAMFRLRFTGAGLNITYNATSMISPWGVDYRTVPNEILEFMSLGSGNYLFYSLNGPGQRVGTTIESNVSATPAGYLPEDGAAVSRTTYSGLFAEISTVFGVGDGATTFNVPDSLGRVAIMVDGAANRITAASTNGANADTLGGAGGAETHALAKGELPSNTDLISDDGVGGGVGTNITKPSTTSSGTITNTSIATFASAGNAHSNTQPWIAKKKFIRF